MEEADQAVSLSVPLLEGTEFSGGAQPPAELVDTVGNVKDAVNCLEVLLEASGLKVLRARVAEDPSLLRPKYSRTGNTFGTALLSRPEFLDLPNEKLARMASALERVVELEEEACAEQ